METATRTEWCEVCEDLDAEGNDNGRTEPLLEVTIDWRCGHGPKPAKICKGCLSDAPRADRPEDPVIRDASGALLNPPSEEPPDPPGFEGGFADNH